MSNQPKLQPVTVASGHRTFDGVDRGVAYYVNRLRTEGGVETSQASEGGPGRLFGCPYVDIHLSADASALIHAFGYCVSLGLPVVCYGEVWDVSPEGNPYERHGRIFFSRRNTEEELAWWFEREESYRSSAAASASMANELIEAVGAETA